MKQLTLQLPPDASTTVKDSNNSEIPSANPIQSFLNWIDALDVAANSANRSQPSRGRERRSSGFTNGPYAEIKESIMRHPFLTNREDAHRSTTLVDTIN